MIAALIVHTQRLPSKFAEVLGDRRELKMRLASLGPMPLWDVELVSSGGGVYLGRGWRQFARTYDLGHGHLLVFRFDAAAVLTVTVFDPSTCRKQYPYGASAPSFSGSLCAWSCGSRQGKINKSSANDQVLERPAPARTHRTSTSRRTSQ